MKWNDKNEIIYAYVKRGVLIITAIRDMLDLGNRDLAARDTYIAGGFARWCVSDRSEKSLIKASDVDIFSPTIDVYEGNKNVLDHTHYLKMAFENDFCVQYDNEAYHDMPKLQLIKPKNEGVVVTEGSMHTILDNFDFTITRAAIKLWQKLPYYLARVDKDFIEHEKSGLLIFHNIHCPVSSLVRAAKYIRKGYFLQPSQALKLFQDWDSREDKHKEKLIQLFEKEEKTDEEIAELEELLRIID